MRPRDTTSESHEAQLQAYRRLGPAGRVSIAARLSADTRELARGGIRAGHPDYTEEEVQRALRRFGGRVFVSTPEDTLLSKLEWAKH